MLLELNERDKKQYDKLFVSRSDLQFARACCSFLIKNGWHHSPWTRSKRAYFKQAAFTTALIAAYGRVFTTSKGWPHFPQKLIKYNVDEKRLHDEILTQRHEVYAHSDSSRHDIRPWSSGGLEIDIETIVSLQISAEDANLFLAMTSKLISEIDARIKELREIAKQSSSPNA